VSQEWLDRGLVRIHDKRQRVIGAGLLIGPRHLITCAHVAAAALGREGLQFRSSAHRQKILVSFPATSGRRRFSARVARGGWRRVDPGTLQGDVAVLELTRSAPAECAVPSLLCPERLDEHDFVAKGFPRGWQKAHPGGAPAKGAISVVSGPGNEWRLLVDDRATLILPGFSGAPVWDETAQAIVGIVVARDHRWVKTRDDHNRGAFMIPLSVLAETWEPLRDAIGWRARFDRERRKHWEPRSRGTQGGEDTTDDSFTGRRKVLGELAAWLADLQPAPGARIVTGRPGAGKSSVLARLVMGADPEEDVTIECDPPAPPLKPVAIAVVCQKDGKGLTVEEVVERVARWTGVEAGSAEELVEVLEQRAESNSRAATIVVDQLNEAADSRGIVSLLLEPLAESGAARILVGLSKGDAELVDLLGDSARVLDLEGEYLDDEDLKDYVVKLLDRPDNVYAGKTNETRRVATEVVSQAGPLFLVARLVALNLAEEDQIAEPRESYPQSVDAAMKEYLERVSYREGADEPERLKWKLRLDDLLGALGYSRGVGLPTGDRTWVAAARAISGNAYDAGDITDLRCSAARFLLQSEEPDADGIIYLRLFHQALVGAVAPNRKDPAVHGRIVRALADLTPADPNAPASPYVRRYLSGHAQIAGADAWTQLAADPKTLDRLAPIPLRNDVAKAALAGDSLPPQLLGVLGSAHLMETSKPGDQAGLRQLGMARVTDCRSFGDEDTSAPPADWTVVSAVMRRQAPHVTFPVDAGVRALAWVEDRGGGPLLVAACADRSVRTWAPGTGEEVIKVIPDSDLRTVAACQTKDRPWVAVGDAGGHVHVLDPEEAGSRRLDSDHGGGGVHSLAAFALHDKAYFAIGGDDDRVQLWVGEAPGVVLRVAGPVRALTARVVGDRVHLAAGADDGRVTLWRLGPAELTTGGAPRPAKELEGPIDWVRTVTLFGDGDDPAVVAGADDGGVYLWPAGARSGSAGERLNEGRAAVLSAVALPTLGAGDPAFATAGNDSTITLWSADGKPHGEPLTGDRSAAICGLAAYPLDGRLGLASADGGGVRIWTPPCRSASKETDQARPVVAVAACPVNGKTLAAIGDARGGIRLWASDGARETSPLDGGPIPRALVPYPHPKAAAGLAVGGDDEQVRFLDATTGEEVEGLDPLRGHRGPVRAVCLEVEGAAFVTGGEDGTVRLWDAEHREIDDRIARPGPPVRGLGVLRRPPHEDWLAVVGHGRSVEVRRAVAPGEVVACFQKHADWAMAVAVRSRSAGPLVITAGDDGAIWAYEPHRALDPWLIGSHIGPVRALATLGDGDSLVVSGGDDGTVRLWDPTADSPARGCLRIGARINALCEIDRQLLVGTDEGHLVIDLKLG
jgi:WD40 repeat protein